MGDLTEVIQHRLLPSPVTVQRSNGNPSPMVIGAESWAVAEREAERIISQCQPTVVSEEKRRDVIDYVQRLIRGYLGCEVFPYGSVPLKTYLPDGDIDLTTFGGANGEDMLADDIVSVLEAEEQNRAAEFIIKDVQLVRAEVKLVKCIVQNIVVDISFNQIGGLCTLCFLEQVDRLIGKDHLFKRSIILIKAWCYYQSRILGAHHGLISTYALETLVLYIFHVFHSTLDGPLAVLYKFLDYFSNFDWETYCISLTGPVRISSLPDIVVETPENGGGDLLLGSDFLRYCSDMFSVPLRGADLNSKTFPQKFLNIVDPLKENNNLGRSVSKGNFCRIRSAFSYGARKLGQILTHRVVDIAEELCIFFSSTLDRQGSGLRPDVQNPIPRSSLSVYASAYSILEAKPCQYNSVSVQDIVENAAVMEVGITQNGRQSSFVDGVFLLEDENYVDRNGFLGNRLTGKAKDISTSSFRGLKISNDSTKISSSSDEEIGSPLHMPPHAPHLYFSKSWLANRTVKNVDVDTNQSENLENKISSVMKDKVPSSIGSKSNQSDLSGDYDSHLTCLLYGRWWHRYASSVPVVTMPPPPPPSPFPGVSLWDPVLLPSQFKRNGFSHGNVNGFIHSSVVYPMNQMLISGVAVGSEEMTKHRGTGTYFPNPNRPPHGYRPLPVKGRNFGQARSSSTKGRAIAFTEANMLERSNMEHLPQSHFTVDQCLGSDSHQSHSQRLKQNLNVNGYISQPEGIVEHGPADRHMPLRAPDPVSSRRPRLASLNPQTTSQGSLVPTTQMPNHVPGSDRLMVQKSYHLKNEDDFPPLSS